MARLEFSYFRALLVAKIRIVARSIAYLTVLQYRFVFNEPNVVVARARIVACPARCVAASIAQYVGLVVLDGSRRTGGGVLLMEGPRRRCTVALQKICVSDKKIRRK